MLCPFAQTSGGRPEAFSSWPFKIKRNDGRRPLRRHNGHCLHYWSINEQVRPARQLHTYLRIIFFVFFFFLSIHTFIYTTTQYYALLAVSLFLIVFLTKMTLTDFYTFSAPAVAPVSYTRQVVVTLVPGDVSPSMLNFEFPVTLVRCRLRISNVLSAVLGKRVLFAIVAPTNSTI